MSNQSTNNPSLITRENKPAGLSLALPSVIYHYNGHTYKLTSDALTWFAAEQEAIASGGHLVSINDKAENIWITNTLMPLVAKSIFTFKSDIHKGTAWIGYSETNIEGQWKWTDNSNSTFTNWLPGEPNNTSVGNSSGEGVAQIYQDGTWNDLNSDIWSLIGIIEIPYIVYSDTSAPKITSFSPENKSANVAINKDIILTFNETVTPKSGFIVLKTENGSLVEFFDINNSKNIFLSDKTLTVNPTVDLLPNTTYRLEIPSGIVQDLAGNSYQSAETYGFKTSSEGASTTSSTEFTGALIITAFKNKYSLSINSIVENVYAKKLQKVIDDNKGVSTELLHDSLVNAMLKLSLIRNSILNLVDINRDGKIGTLTEINSAKSLLKELLGVFSTEVIVNISSKNQVFDASGKNFIFNLNADLDTTIAGFTKGDKINLIPSLSLKTDISFDAGIVGDGHINLVVVNEGTTNLIQLTGITKSLDVSNLSLTLLQQTFGENFIY